MAQGSGHGIKYRSTRTATTPVPALDSAHVAAHAVMPLPSVRKLIRKTASAGDHPKAAKQKALKC
jgi:hypothetical protein